MSSKEKVNHKPIALLGDNGHKNNGHDHDNGHKNNGHDRDNGHDKVQEIAENTLNPFEIPNKYKAVNLEGFNKILNNVDVKNRDEDLEFVLDLTIALAESIRFATQLKEAFNSPLQSPIYQYHYSRAEILSKALEQFLWFCELRKKNSIFDFSTIEDIRHNNSKKN